MAEQTLKVKITGDASDVQKALSVAQRAVTSFESKISSIGKSVSKIGSKLTKYITTPAITATSALVGITLVKGFNRLQGIDEARAKLKGLGHDAESIEEIMNSALTSVKGTSYGLDEAATTAASAVAAGIKPGKELTRYLTLTADAAAIAGSSMSDMGSIFNKVQTSQRAYTEELNQLADRGVPIYQWIADEAGVTADAVKELASDGAVSSEMFLNAVEKNIGGAAKIMGESSFNAVIANIGASLSRIGANFLDAGEAGGGFFSQVKPLLAELNEELGVVENKAADLGEKSGAAFSNIVEKVKELKTQFSELPPEIQKASAAGAIFAVGLGPGLEILGHGMETISSVSGGVGKAFSGIKNSINGIPKTFTTLGKGFKSVAGDFKNLGSGIMQPFKGFGSMIAGAISETSAFQKASAGIFGIVSNMSSKISKFKTVVSGISDNAIELFNNKISVLGASISQKFPKITSAFQKLGQGANTIFSKLSENAKGMTGRIGESLSSLLGKVKTFASSFGITFAKGLSIAAGIAVLVAGMGLLQENFGTQINSLLTQAAEKGPQLISNFCSGIVSALPNLMTQGANLITMLLNTITALLPSIITGGVSIVSALVSGLARNLPALIPAAMDMIITLVTGLLDNLPQLINSGLQLLVGIVKGIINSLPRLVAAIPQIISSIVITIGKNLPTILQTGIELLVMIINGILQAIPDLIAALPRIISTIQDAFEDTDWLQIGKDLLNSIIEGIKSVVSNLWSTIKDIVSGIKEKFTFSVSGSSSSSGNSIPQNAHGTDYWSGGFTYMNEGGRGELVSLPSGSQIIPHDISVKYAKEAARSNTADGYLDGGALGDYIVAAVVDTSRMYAEQMAKGISNMRMTVNNREAGRFMSDLGFVRR